MGVLVAAALSALFFALMVWAAIVSASFNGYVSGSDVSVGEVSTRDRENRLHDRTVSRSRPIPKSNFLFDIFNSFVKLAT